MALKDMSYMFPIFPIIGSITFVLCILPVPAHWKMGNVAIVSFSLWNAIGILICVIDTCVWHGNIRNPYPVWGDIVQVYFSVLSTTLASCNFCIQYRLWSVARAKSVFISKKGKRQERFITLFFCFGVSIIVGILHYVVQGHRYNVIEDLGPTEVTYNTTLAFPIFYIWEPLICLISGLFAIHTIALFIARRKEMEKVLDSGSINLNRTRYVRIMALAAVAACIHLPLASWIFFVDALDIPVSPWISWEETHSNYSRIGYTNRFYLSLMPQHVVWLSVAWWSLILSGLCVFLFFGTGDEAILHYKNYLRKILGLFGIDFPRETKRPTVIKTWIDVLLCRPGQPILTDSTQSPVWHPNHDMNFTFSISQISTDLPADTTTNVLTGDVLEQVKMQPHPSKPIIEQQEIGSPLRAEKSTPSDSGRSTSKEGSSIGTDGDPVQKMVLETVNPDLERQVISDLEIAQQRRREILEKDPELTEEVSF